MNINDFDDMDDLDDEQEDEEIRSLVARYESEIGSGVINFYDSDEFEDIVDYYFRQGRLKLMRNALEFGLVRYPNSAGLHVRMGRFLARRKRYDQAMASFRQAERIDPESVELYLMRGYVHLEMQEYDQANKDYDKALEIYGEDEEILTSIASDLIHTPLYQKAFKHLNRLLELDPENIDALTDVILLLNSHSETLPPTIDYLKEFLNNNPYSSYGWYRLAYAYIVTELYEKALEAIDFSIAIEDDIYKAHFMRAHILVSLEKYNEAIESYKQAQAMDETDTECNEEIAKCYYQLGDYSNTIDYYLRALVNASLPNAILYQLALAYEGDNQLDKALEAVEEAMYIEYETNMRQIGDTYISLGFNREKPRRLNSPRDYLVVSIRGLMLKARILVRKGHIEEAVKVCRLISRHPNFDQINDIFEYAEFLATTQGLVKAIRVLKKKAESRLYYNAAPLYYRLAAYAFRNNQKKLGLNALQKALKMKFRMYRELFDFAPELAQRSEIKELIDHYRPVRKSGNKKK